MANRTTVIGTSEPRSVFPSAASAFMKHTTGTTSMKGGTSQEAAVARRRSLMERLSSASGSGGAMRTSLW